MDTKAGVEGDEARLGRLKNADEILQNGPEWAIEQLMPRLLSPVTLNSRLDVLEQAKATMRRRAQKGWPPCSAGWPGASDSLATLAEIDVPSVLGGEDDAPSPVSELERMAHGIRGPSLIL